MNTYLIDFLAKLKALAQDPEICPNVELHEKCMEAVEIIKNLDISQSLRKVHTEIKYVPIDVVSGLNKLVLDLIDECKNTSKFKINIETILYLSHYWTIQKNVLYHSLNKNFLLDKLDAYKLDITDRYESENFCFFIKKTTEDLVGIKLYIEILDSFKKVEI